MVRFLTWWKRKLRYLYLRLRRSQSSHPQKARGLSAGVFSGMFPLFGFQTIIAIGLAKVIRGDVLVAAIGTWISNPLTDLPIFTFNFRVGLWLLNRKDFSLVQPRSWGEMGTLGQEILTIWFAGCLVVGTISAVIAYFVGLWLSHRLSR